MLVNKFRPLRLFQVKMTPRATPYLQSEQRITVQQMDILINTIGQNLLG